MATVESSMEKTSAAAPKPEAAQEEPAQRVVIKPSSGWRALDISEAWRYREILYFLIWRDWRVRYKQTLLGALWAVIKPLFPAVLFTFIFHRLFEQPSEGIPYQLFTFSGAVVWTYFSTALNTGSGALVGYSYLVTKIYFPRVLIPTASVLSGLLDLVIALGILVVMMLWYGWMPAASALIAVPLLTLLTILLALGLSLWLGAMNVKYRDVGQLIGLLMQVWVFATPVYFSFEKLAPDYRWWAAFNPLYGIMQGFRCAVFGHQSFEWYSLGVSSAMTLVILVTGLFYFRRLERTFADVI